MVAVGMAVNHIQLEEVVVQVIVLIVGQFFKISKE
jgi:hypothetical protein